MAEVYFFLKKKKEQKKKKKKMLPSLIDPFAPPVFVACRINRHSGKGYFQLSKCRKAQMLTTESHSGTRPCHM
jgi:hypothetical protein